MTWRPRYHCAPTLFRDEMARGLTAPPPYDHCKTTPDVVDVDALVRYAAARANASAIDALAHLLLESHAAHVALLHGLDHAHEAHALLARRVPLHARALHRGLHNVHRRKPKARWSHRRGLVVNSC
jgi:hypothetical protein